MKQLLTIAAATVMMIGLSAIAQEPPAKPETPPAAPATPKDKKAHKKGHKNKKEETH